jgi:hypothetical protein
MQALAASCEELRARTGNPPLDLESASKRYIVNIIILFQSFLHVNITVLTMSIDRLPMYEGN